MLTCHVVMAGNLEEPVFLVRGLTDPPLAELCNLKNGEGKWQEIPIPESEKELTESEKKALHIVWKVDTLSAGSIPTTHVLQGAFRQGWSIALGRLPWQQPDPPQLCHIYLSAYELLVDISEGSKGAIDALTLLHRITHLGWKMGTTVPK